LTHIPGFSTYGISPNIRRILEIIEGEFVGWVEATKPNTTKIREGIVSKLFAYFLEALF